MTYRVIHRGAPRPILLEFRCPLHGWFDELVDSGTEEMPCPFQAACGAPSPWSPRKVPTISMRRVEATRGKAEAPEHKGWLDTSNLEEGQDPEEFQAERDAVHEELRKDLVTEMVKSDR